MTNKQKNILTVGLTLLLLAATAIYIYKDLGKTNDSVLTLPTKNAQTAGISLETNASSTDYKVTVLPPPPADDKTASIGPKIPNLDLPVANYSHMDSAAFEVAAKDIAILEGDLKKDPSDQSKWLQLAIFRKMTGDYRVSANILNYLAILWPKDYVPFNNLGDLYQFYIKNYPLAEKSWLKVVELNSSDIQAYENLYDLYSGLYKEKQMLALPILLRGLDNNPASTHLMLLIARYYKSAGDKGTAAIYYNKAIKEAQAENNSALETSVQSEEAALSM